MTDGVVTRFAPSPTGFLHIGGARTALFNWLYARAKGGRMLLRIEDTDRERSTPEAVDAIIEGLKWMGLEADGEPVSQFANGDRHRAVVEELLAKGQAYKCYASQEELAEMREKAKAEKRAPRYDGRWRDRDPSEAPSGVDPVIRLKAPLDGETIVDDQVQGRVRFNNKELDDFVLLRSDGSPTYMLAVVVDDHDMGVTHIIRGDDHLTNGARQALIYKAMGWDVPVMAHIPLIHGPDGAKLSKRHGALGIEAYRAMGYLPVALRNYLVRLGWAHGDDEIISTEDMIAWFDVSEINKGAARFDFKKLEALNGWWIRQSGDEALTDQLMAERDALPNGDILKGGPDAEVRARLLAAMPGLKERAKTLVELADSATYLFAQRPLPLEEKAETILADGGRDTIAELTPRLEAVADWAVEPLEAEVRTFAEEKGLKLGKAAQPLRAALTGRSTSPGVFDVLAVLGREEALARLRDQFPS
ncbi:glutamyl-tRNA synthetase [Fulvimarina pelagi HTCC2506]|uniref:Glutamate--tRNA ligase n=1 Tax=Fulvimarina pelagi HTCC2506 TaxID=314231 RepID=Q0G3H0_9HYPH|nr:glutamate--tRNA ligase [Fulvimarina pelagi]EAU41861.1 glutamyl-tRNA synthetase [Fulvimarina pelagi HTCC2506]